MYPELNLEFGVELVSEDYVCKSELGRLIQPDAGKECSHSFWAKRLLFLWFERSLYVGRVDPGKCLVVRNCAGRKGQTWKGHWMWYPGYV